MRFQIRRCSSCRAYTLEETCPKCGGPAESAHPAKFSPDDRYMRYRLRAKYEEQS
jgi:H/ACA ribonucleoprotein complex subunit 3